MDSMSVFRVAITATGLNPPTQIPRGKFVRFPGLGKQQNNDAGWCILFEDGQGGAFGDFSSSINSTWQATRPQKFTQREQQEFNEKVRKARQESEQLRAFEEALAAAQAKKRWEAASQSVDSPYLKNKGIRSYGIRQESDGCLLVPIKNPNGKIVSLQTIDPNGQKRFLKGGAIQGNYYLIGEPTEKIVVCEGFATGASIHEATGSAVVVAFNAGNLAPVVKSLSVIYPIKTLILAADDDYTKSPNTGLTKATEAALAVGGLLAVPRFKLERHPDWSDFNDLHLHEGIEAVKHCFSPDLIVNPAIVWDDPIEIRPHLTPELYPTQALPQTIRNAVEEVQAFVKSPIALVASSALASLSVAAQGHIDIQRNPGLTGPTSLFLLAIAPSGERKSSSDNFMAEPILEYDQQQAAMMKDEIKRYQAQLAVWKAKHDGIVSKIRSLRGKSQPTNKLEEELLDLQKNEPERPRVPHLLLGDATPEGLSISLTREWPSGGIFSSEGGVILGSHGMGSDSLMRNLGILNVLWDGGTHQMTRRTSDRIEIRGVRLTMALQTQEQTLKEFFSKTSGLARGMGFFARFLVTFPESTQGTRLFSEAPTAWPNLNKFRRRLDELLNTPLEMTDDYTLTPKLMQLSPEAKAVWIAFHDSIEVELRHDGELTDVRDVASKAADNAARLAALFQIYESGFSEVTANAMQAATQIVAWHLHEARRLLPQLTLRREERNLIAIDQWIIRQCRNRGTNHILKNELRQKGPIRNVQEIDLMLAELISLKRIRIVERQRITIEVNPALLGGNDGTT